MKKKTIFIYLAILVILISFAILFLNEFKKMAGGNYFLIKKQNTEVKIDYPTTSSAFRGPIGQPSIKGPSGPPPNQ